MNSKFFVVFICLFTFAFCGPIVDENDIHSEENDDPYKSDVEEVDDGLENVNTGSPSGVMNSFMNRIIGEPDQVDVEKLIADLNKEVSEDVSKTIAKIVSRSLKKPTAVDGFRRSNRNELSGDAKSFAETLKNFWSELPKGLIEMTRATPEEIRFVKAIMTNGTKILKKWHHYLGKHHDMLTTDQAKANATSLTNLQKWLFDTMNKDLGVNVTKLGIEKDNAIKNRIAIEHEEEDEIDPDAMD